MRGWNHLIRSKNACGLTFIVCAKPAKPLLTMDWPLTILIGSTLRKRNHITDSLGYKLNASMMDKRLGSKRLVNISRLSPPLRHLSQRKVCGGYLRARGII